MNVQECTDEIMRPLFYPSVPIFRHINYNAKHTIADYRTRNAINMYATRPTIYFLPLLPLRPAAPHLPARRSLCSVRLAFQQCENGPQSRLF